MIPPELAHRIRHRLYALHHALGVGLGRHIEHVAVHIEFPAVIEAAQAAFLVAREEQRDAAMRAELFEQPDLAPAVAEDDQILAHEPHAPRRGVGLDLLAQRRGDPVAADHPPHRRITLDAAQQRVLFGGQHDGPLLTLPRTGLLAPAGAGSDAAFVS